MQNVEPIVLGSSSVMVIQVANLTSNLSYEIKGEKPKRHKPCPYKTRGFRHMLHSAFDCKVRKRFDDNSKVIAVEGPLASGKNALAKKIAEEFDLLYVPEVTDTEYYMEQGNGEFDIREYDEQLPVGAQSVDFERFFLQNGSKALLKNFARTQYELFRTKLKRYAHDVTAPLLNTGQGVVMTRGMWSDIIWAHTLHKTGYISSDALKAFQYQYQVSTDYFNYPHLIIYLDNPIDKVKENIQKRGTSWEVNSPVITDEFLHAMEDAYKNVYLSEMKKHSEIMMVDLSEEQEPDFDYLSEELEKLNLDEAPLEHPKRFKSWQKPNRELNFMRNDVCIKNQKEIKKIFMFDRPLECPELLLLGPDWQAYDDIVNADPRICYDKNYQPDDPMRFIRFW
jgi:NADH dehydrogenase (ubiquinone) 1 alpha subcomplex subunit 10